MFCNRQGGRDAILIWCLVTIIPYALANQGTGLAKRWTKRPNQRARLTLQVFFLGG